MPPRWSSRMGAWGQAMEEGSQILGYVLWDRKQAEVGRLRLTISRLGGDDW